MTREQQDAAWRSLPDGFKKEVSRHYKSWHNSLAFGSECAVLDYLFGKHNLTASKEQTIEESAMDKHIFHASEKQRLKEYAAKNRKQLEAQEVTLGDVVKVLLGQFAGENGIVKGIIVPDNDFNNPYYEVDMECEVPDKYKCRKTLISPNNVIGGLTKSDFEVINNSSAAQNCEKFAEKGVSGNADCRKVDWLAYRMELAKEVVNGLLFTGKSPETIADETTTIVNGIVERLKGE